MRAAIRHSYSSGSTAEMLDEADSPVEGLEAGTLAIHTNARQKTDIWRRPAPRFHKKPAPWLTFEIPFARVLPAVGATASDAAAAADATPNNKRYVVYDINVRHDAHSPDGFDINPASIERRYTHFLRLSTALRRAHPAAMHAVPFPGKVLIGNFSAPLIAARSATFETFLDHVCANAELRDSPAFLDFLQDAEVQRACRLLDERRHELAVPLLASSFRLLNRVYTDKAPCVLLLLCRLVAACTTSPMPHADAERWCELALRRYESVSDADLLVLYVPLLQTCQHLWWQRGRDNGPLAERLACMQRQGVNTKAKTTLTQAIHAMDPRTETM